MVSMVTERYHSFASQWHCQSLLHQQNEFWRQDSSLHHFPKEVIPLMKVTLIMRYAVDVMVSIIIIYNLHISCYVKPLAP